MHMPCFNASHSDNPRSNAIDPDPLGRLLRVTLDRTLDAILVCSVRGDVVYTNAAFHKLHGAEVPNRHYDKEAHTQAFAPAVLAHLLAGEATLARWTLYDETGAAREIEESLAPVIGDDGRVTHIIAVQRDVSEREYMHAQMIKAQRIDTVGRIASSVAHDFNNVMTAIRTFAEFLRERVAGDPEATADVHDLLCSIGKAQALTRRLRTLSTHHQVQLEALDLRNLCRDFEPLLRFVVGDRAHLHVLLGNEPLPVLGNALELEQVVLNLVVNAADAVGDGGTITVACDRFDLRNPEHPSGLSPGLYARLRVQDNGCGISPQHLEHIFDPLFTTKEPDRGSGLGLFTVRRVLDRHNGRITVASRVGEGSTFTVYLPLDRTHQMALHADLAAQTVPAAVSRILVVDDDPRIAGIVEQTLAREGYEVVACTKVEDIFVAAAASALLLLITDIVMPGSDGFAIAAELRRTRPQLPVLFMSGWSNLWTQETTALPAHIALLPKPFTPLQLRAAVRKLLDSEPR